jgi:hypothetical protein
MFENGLKNIEVWFKDGTFRCFPKVQGKTLKTLSDNNFLCFIFGEHEHEAVINLSNVLFTETMDYIDNPESHN